MVSLEDYLKEEGIIPLNIEECNSFEEQILGKEVKKKLDEMANNATMLFKIFLIKKGLK